MRQTKWKSLEEGRAQTVGATAGFQLCLRRVAALHGTLPIGRTYTGAKTNGDGTCAFHACWRRPSEGPETYGGGQWYECDDARTKLHEMLTLYDVEDLLNGFAQLLSRILSIV